MAKAIKRENYRHYEVEASSGYHVVHMYKGDVCIKTVFIGPKKQAEKVAGELDTAYREAIFDLTGQWTKY